MEYLSSGEMREIDRHCIEKIKVSETKLVEMAGLRTAEVIRENFEPQKIRCFIGKGNNGADGLVAARKLKDYGFDPVVSAPGDLRENGEEELRLAKNCGVRSAEPGQEIDSELVLDALFGYSIKGDPRPPYDLIISRINSENSKTVSVDVPSGLNPEKGRMQDPAVEPDLVVTLAAPKRGLKSLDSEVFLADIGIPSKAYSSEGKERPSEFESRPLIRLK